MDQSWTHQVGGFVILAAVLLLFWARRFRLKGYWQRAHAALQGGDLGEAEKYLRKCLKATPESAAIRRMLGAVLARTERLDEAETLFVSATALEPRNGFGYLQLGLFQALCFGDREDEALESFGKALELAPEIRDVLEKEPRLASLRGSGRFQALMRGAVERAEEQS